MTNEPKPRRGFMRRVWADGTVEEHELEVRLAPDGSAWLYGSPPVDTSAAERNSTWEFVVEWEDA